MSQSVQWTEDGVANLASDEALELARWFLRGQSIGSKPIFDGICAMCGTLLHGSGTIMSSLCNRTRGPPLDRDGNPFLTTDGQPDVNAQPPFLLRFSPAFFANEVPAMFIYESATNTLRLRDGLEPPWVVQTSDGQWEYCKDCGTQWLGSNRTRKKSHIPYRDAASQHFMKPVQREQRTTGASQTSRPGYHRLNQSQKMFHST